MIVQALKINSKKIEVLNNQLSILQLETPRHVVIDVKDVQGGYLVLYKEIVG